MGVSQNKDSGLNLPESTGAVEYQPPQDPPGIDPDTAGESTGAVKYEGPVGGKKVTNPDAENGAQAEVTVKPATGPVTMTTSWLSESEAKVVTKEQQEAARQSVQPRKSAVAETPEDDVKAEQKAAEEPADPAAVERPGGDDLPAGEPSGPNDDEPRPEAENPPQAPADAEQPASTEQATAGTEQPADAEQPKAKNGHGGRRAAKNVGEAKKDD
jgi:hypothetical protein